MAKKLTAKQQQFVLEYMKDLNATQAAIRAGYSENTANIIGSENLAKPYIAKAIEKQMEKRSTRVKMTADDVLREIKELIHRNKGKDDRTALKALETYGRHLQLFTDKIELTGKVDIEGKIPYIEKYLKDG